MSIFRITKQSNFSIISNIPLNDNRLSFKAKGLWAYLMSKPDDWDVYMSHLAHVGPDGKDSIRSGIHELMANGYVERHQVRTLEGKYTGYEYVINENSILEKNQLSPVPKSENPPTGKPTPVNQQLLRTEKLPKTEKNDDVPQPSENPPPPDPPPPVAAAASTPDEKTNSEILGTLIALVPEEMRKPSVIAKLSQAIAAGIAIDTIRGCILYSNAFSDKATWQRYRSHLGRCIDEKWGQGFEDEKGGAPNQIDEQAIVTARLSMPVGWLEIEAGKGDRYAIKALSIINGGKK